MLYFLKSKFNSILKSFKVFTIILMTLIVLGGAITSSAQSICNDIAPTKNVKVWDIVNPSTFLPLIPERCGFDKNGDIAPLPVSVIGDLLLRAFALMFSLAFYILPMSLVVLGLRFVLISYDPELNKTQFTEVTTLARTVSKTSAQFVVGILVVVFAYTIVFSVLNLLGIQTENTNIKDFFTFNE
jgi:hypothetical protein